MSTENADQGFKPSALIAAGVAFIVVYAVGVVAIVLVSTLFQGSPLHDALMLALRIGGWLALAFPAWVAARIATTSEWTYGAVFGVLQGLTVMLLMTQSFSWEGTLRAEVLNSMLPAFALVFASAMLGSTVARWQNHRLQAHQQPNRDRHQPPLEARRLPL